jgi:mannose-6-phosphate isomerase-like protein (cupin superfamily)
MQPRLVQLDEMEPVPCPCGEARRAFTDLPGAVASVHLVEIKADAALHHHRKGTEIYVVLEGSGFIEVDGERLAVKPLSVVYLPSGVRHRAAGRMRIINVAVPVFDPADEFVEPAETAGRGQSAADTLTTR